MLLYACLRAQRMEVVLVCGTHTFFYALLQSQTSLCASALIYVVMPCSTHACRYTLLRIHAIVRYITDTCRISYMQLIDITMLYGAHTSHCALHHS